MSLNRRQLILLAAGGSALLMLGALGFQHLGGLAPCKMCIWQRWPHVIALLIGLLAIVMPGRALPLAGALAALTTSAIGFYHAGVEQKWWEGPASCTGSGNEGLSGDALFEQIMGAPLVRCDEIPWDMFGLSMASWNAVIALGLSLIWLAAMRRS